MDFSCCKPSVTHQPTVPPHVLQSCVEVSRTLYAVLLETFPSKEPIWRSAAQLEMQHGTPQQVRGGRWLGLEPGERGGGSGR